MAYSTYEESKEGGQPVELFKFTVGATIYRFTSSDVDETFMSETWTSEPLMRSAPTHNSTNSSGREMQLELPTSNVIAQRYAVLPPAVPVDVEVMRFHRGDPAAGISLWKGRVMSPQYSKQGRMCTLNVAASGSSLVGRQVPSRKCSSLCPYALYDVNTCKATKASFKHTDVVTAVTSATITVDNLSTKGANWAVAGFVEWGTESRLIIAQSGNVITLQIPFPESPMGESVDVYAGCDRTLATCNTKFTNDINFGGVPYVPTRNVFQTGL